VESGVHEIPNSIAEFGRTFFDDSPRFLQNMTIVFCEHGPNGRLCKVIDESMVSVKPFCTMPVDRVA
jgi:hypothetical protein